MLKLFKIIRGIRHEGKNKKIRSFRFKWYEFFLIYGLINYYFFTAINSSLFSLQREMINCYSDNLEIDGTDFVPFFNFMSFSFLTGLWIIVAIIIIMISIISLLIFRFIYFRSVINQEEINKLLKYMKNTIILLIMVNIAASTILFYIEYHSFNYIIIHLLGFLGVYVTIPLFTYLLIYVKLKKIHNIS